MMSPRGISLQHPLTRRPKGLPPPQLPQNQPRRNSSAFLYCSSIFCWQLSAPNANSSLWTTLSASFLKAALSYLTYTDNSAIADSLSHFPFQKFRLLAPDSNEHQTPAPLFSATIFNWFHNLMTWPSPPRKASSKVLLPRPCHYASLGGIDSKPSSPPLIYFPSWTSLDIHFFIKIMTGTPCTSLSHAHITMLIKGFQQLEPPLPIIAKPPFSLHPHTLFQIP